MNVFVEQKRPPWGCTHGTYPLHICGHCIKEAEEHETRVALIQVLERLLERFGESDE